MCVSLRQWNFTCRAHFSPECQFLWLSVRAFWHQLFIFFYFLFRPKIVFWLDPWSLVACIAEMAEQLPFSCLCKAVVEEKRKKKFGEREREHTQNGEDRITFVCFSFISSVFSLQLVCVFSPVQAKSKTEQCQCAFKYHSIEHEREHYNYACVSVGLCRWIHIILCAYVCSCMCMCSPRGAYLCHCQYVQVGSGGQLCACV